MLAYLGAIRLLLGAQAVYRGVTMESALTRLTRQALLPSDLTVAQAKCGIRRATRRLSRTRWFHDGCLVRAIALSVLIADRPGVLIHIGFSGGNPGDGEPRALGHAWVSCRGVIVSDERGADVGHAYFEAKQLVVHRLP